MENFYYHPKQTDIYLGKGPTPNLTYPGWIVVQAASEDEALKKLPLVEQERVAKRMLAHEREMGEKTSFTDFMNDTAGHNMGFTFFSQDEWDESQE